MPGSSSSAAAASRRCSAVLGFDDVSLINTPFAVLLGIVYGYLPLMVFPIYVSLEKLDRRLLEASADLYAHAAVGTFLQVTLPLSLPGVVTGSHAGLHPADGRVPDPGAARRRQGLLHRQCAGRPLPAVAQLAVRRGRRRGPGRDHAGHRHASTCGVDPERGAVRDVSR